MNEYEYFGNRKFLLYRNKQPLQVFSCEVEPMGGKNYVICHSCRDPGHWLDDCPIKQRCPRCGEGFVRLLEVEKMGDSRGKLFFSCTRRNCRYFDWKKESSTGAQMETNTEADMEELTRLMKSCARVTKEDDVDVNLITFCKSKGRKREDRRLNSNM